MTDVTELNSRLASLKRARDSGVLMVRHGDIHTTFRSLDELNAIIAELEGDISALTTPRRRVRYIFQSDKGL